MAVPGANRGHSLGRYRLIAELGHGGMADVYLAVSQGPAGFNKLLVIKQLRPALAEDPEFLTMFLDEARLAARLSHRNVVQTYEVGIDDGRYFLAMEYLDGQALKRISHRARPAGLPLTMHLRILSETLAGLHHAHELRDFDGTPLAVVHRDVSPHNLFVTYAGEVKVVDFGIAKALDSSAETGAGVMKGKLAYMSPEQARSERVDRRADIFSMGVLLWEAMAGRRLWEGMSSSTIVNRLLVADLPRVRDYARDVPEGLEAICMRALAHSAEDRFATAAEFQRAIDDWLDGTGDRTTYDELGARVSSLFVEDRLALQEIIEKQLAAVNYLSSGEFQQMQLPEIESLSLPTLTPSNQKRARTDSGSRRSVESADLADLGTPVPNGSSTPGPTVRESPPDSDRRSRAVRWPLIAILGALTASGFLALLFGFSSMRSGEGTEGASLAATAPAVGPATSAEAGNVALKIDVHPREATVLLDGNRIIASSYTSSVPRGSSHTLHAEAPGYQSITREIVAGENTTLDLTLEKLDGSARGDAGSSPGATPAAPSETDGMDYVQPKKTGTGQPKRPLDSRDPWDP